MTSAKKLDLRQPKNEFTQTREINETRLLQYFSKIPGAKINEVQAHLFDEDYSLFRASVVNFSGSGRGNSRHLGCIKAVAECLERMVVNEAFQSSLHGTPAWRRTSNGFAVNFDAETAALSATNEAMERHILQMSYLTDGWSGFYLIDEKFDTRRQLKLTRVGSKFSCTGFRAGAVIATSHRFPGVSLGFICEREAEFESSERWNHAYFEAVDKIEPMLAQVPGLIIDDLTPIAHAAFDWLLGAPIDLSFEKTHIRKSLADVHPDVVIFDLQPRWQLNFPFFAAFVSGSNILPLLVPRKILPEDRTRIAEMLGEFGLPPIIPERNPII